MELYAAVGVYFAFDPVICGGYFEDDSGGHSSNKCYKYTKSEWQDFTEMIYKRHFSSGIVYKDSLHIFGGGDFETGRILQSTEIISYDGVRIFGKKDLQAWESRQIFIQVFGGP